jgi:hypothetical protein
MKIYPCGAGTVHTLEQYLVASGLIARGVTGSLSGVGSCLWLEAGSPAPTEVNNLATDPFLLAGYNAFRLAGVVRPLLISPATSRWLQQKHIAILALDSDKVRRPLPNRLEP